MCEMEWRHEAVELENIAEKLKQQNLSLQALVIKHSLSSDTEPGNIHCVPRKRFYRNFCKRCVIFELFKFYKVVQ